MLWKSYVDVALQTTASFCHTSHWKNPTISRLTSEGKMLLREDKSILEVQNYTEITQKMYEMCRTIVQNYTHYHNKI